MSAVPFVRFHKVPSQTNLHDTSFEEIALSPSSSLLFEEKTAERRCGFAEHNGDHHLVPLLLHPPLPLPPPLLLPLLLPPRLLPPLLLPHLQLKVLSQNTS